MTFKITYTKESAYFLVVTKGRMNSTDFIEMAESILNREERPRGVIFDHRKLNFDGVDIVALTKIRRYHEKNDDRIGNGKSAIVLEKNKIAGWFQLWSQGEKAAVSNTVQLFNNLEEAAEWVTG